MHDKHDKILHEKIIKGDVDMKNESVIMASGIILSMHLGD